MNNSNQHQQVIKSNHIKWPKHIKKYGKNGARRSKTNTNTTNLYPQIISKNDNSLKTNGISNKNTQNKNNYHQSNTHLNRKNLEIFDNKVPKIGPKLKDKQMRNKTTIYTKYSVDKKVFNYESELSNLIGPTQGIR